MFFLFCLLSVLAKSLPRMLECGPALLRLFIVLKLLNETFSSLCFSVVLFSAS